MNDIVVYSMTSERSPLKHNLNWHQMLYSIETIRQRSQIPIKIFLAPLVPNMLDTSDPTKRWSNVEIIPFDNQVNALYKSYVNLGYAQLLDHRWRNAWKAFELFDCDRLIYLDGDTVWSRAPEELLSKYNDHNAFYVRDDLAWHVSSKIGIDYGMNDGQFILSRVLYNKIHERFEAEHGQAVYDLLKRTEKILDSEDHLHLHWLSVQYSAYKLLLDYGVPIVKFDKLDCSLSTEPTWLHKPGQPCHLQSYVHHYFSGNTTRYLPREFWPENYVQHFNQELNGRTPCGCGSL